MSALQCPKCKKWFQNRALQFHIKGEGGCIPHSVIAYCCSFCDNDFPNELEYTEHSIICKQKIERVMCSYCYTSFENGIKLREHRVRNHEKFRCDTCNSGYPELYKLKLHIKKNPDHEPKSRLEESATELIPRPVPYKRKYQSIVRCDHCGLCFKKPKQLRDHLQLFPTHYYICIVCSSTFIKKNELDMHMIIHKFCTKCDRFLNDRKVHTCTK